MKSMGDIWLLREPPITEAEWASFLASRSDFVTLENPLGRTPGGKIVSPPRLSLWQGGSSGEVVFAFSAQGVHVSPADAETVSFAEAIAAQFGAAIQYG